MKTFILGFSAFFTLFILSKQLQANTIYRWVDQNGNQHFSDKIPLSNPATEFQSEPLSSIELVKSKPLKKIGRSKRKINHSNSKPSRCAKLKHKIESIKTKLKQRLLAEKSDQYGQELKELRWQKIKFC